MPSSPTEPLLLQHRDGVSQAQRRQAALDPNYVAVDERSIKDLLAFAQQYAKELRYYNLQNKEAGDWSAFLDLNLDDVLLFLWDPDKVAPANAPRFRQPHFVLFLTFLQLLQHAQKQMNTLTKRHLDFYYQQALRISKQPAKPDQVNVVVELAAGVAQAALPVGTRLQAGTDSLGQDLVYQIDRDVDVSRAQVARRSSVYVEKRIIGIREARELPRTESYDPFMEMLKTALGDPKPGNPLPPYPLYGSDKKQEVTYHVLCTLYELVKSAGTTPNDENKKIKDWLEKLFMSAEKFIAIMEVAEKISPTSQDWDNVYAILAEAYKEKIYSARRAKLQEVRENYGIGAMARFALGETQAEEGEDHHPLSRFEPFIKGGFSRTFLSDIQQRIQTGTVTNEEWDTVYRIVEAAQRNRENFPEPVAHKEIWQNLYAAEEATSVSVTPSVDQQDTLRWKTFGRALLVSSQDTPPPASFGWAFCSPLLFLAQGVRTITLTLGFAPDHFDVDALTQKPFLIQLSTDKGWMEPNDVTLTATYVAPSGTNDSQDTKLREIQVTITLNAKDAPIVPLPTEVDSFPSSWPALRLLLRPVWQSDPKSQNKEQYLTQYGPFRDLQLVSTHITVKVEGLAELQIENDEAVLTAGRPIEPFGTSPAVGSRFFLGHPELVAKKLDTLDFHLAWMGVPEKLGEYYQNYGVTGLTDNTSFTVDVSLVDRHSVISLNKNAPLFAETNTNTQQTISVTSIPAPVQREPHLVTDGDVRTWGRYLQWKLNAPDFQHTAYPTVVTRKSIELATDIANKATGNAASYQVNPPYTPKLKSLSVDYTSSTEVDMATYHTGSQIDQILHIHPFGYSEVQPDPQTKQYRFLPQYNNEGELYIGIRDLQPPQRLALLFQLAEGSADPDVNPCPVHWSYLSNNQWLSLENGNIVRDTTRGLRNTGIIEFSLVPAQPNTVLPADLYWLRAAIAQNSNSVCDTVSVHPQAVSATFVDQNNAPDHLSKPLSAKTITQLVEPVPEVRAIQQPYTSYGGKTAEQDSHLYTRVSERLRHKQRALTIWDYEHLILQQFPEVYKVKCLPANASEHPDDPGRIEVIVIPDIKNKLPFNPFEPKASANLLANITTYLEDKVPNFATVVVKNAYYVPVKLRFAVRFRAGTNEEFSKQQLNEDLVRFLSPWAYGEEADIVIGGRLYANTIINFIEERPYVDYVAMVKLFSFEDRSTPRLAKPLPDDGYYVTTERPDGVLVSAQRHEIDIISEADFEPELFRGINYMKIELDFVVGGN